jgi:hypothetical protein
MRGAAATFAMGFLLFSDDWTGRQPNGANEIVQPRARCCRRKVAMEREREECVIAGAQVGPEAAYASGKPSPPAFQALSQAEISAH